MGLLSPITAGVWWIPAAGPLRNCPKLSRQSVAAYRCWSTVGSVAAQILSRLWPWVPKLSVSGGPYLWGLGAFGQPGVERFLEILRNETRVAMQQVGAPSIKQLIPAMVQKASA